MNVLVAEDRFFECNAFQNENYFKEYGMYLPGIEEAVERIKLKERRFQSRIKQEYTDNPYLVFADMKKSTNR